ncbi:hypothetical protein Hanom_Chr03g00211051 [Helianthus anomalus]
MKEKSSIDELNKLEELCETQNDWYTKEEKEKKKKVGKRTPTPKVQAEEGASSQPQKKRKKKAVETLLVDEPEEDEIEANVEKDQEQLSPETERLLKDIDDTLGAEKIASKKVVGDEEKSSSGAEGDMDDEVDRWIKEKYDPKDREKQKKRKRSSDDDETYVPLEDIQDEKTPSSGGRKKSTSRKRVRTPAARKLKFKLKINPPSEPQYKPSSPPPNQPKSPSPPQNQPIPPSPPPQQPSPDPLQSPQSPSRHHISSPIHEQPPIPSPHIQQTPPTIQPPVRTTPGSSGFENFPPIPESIVLEKLDDFSFVNDDFVKKLQKKVNEVFSEKKKLEERTF